MSSLATLPRGASAEVRIASEEIFGTVAHELRQPLSNIEAIAYYLSMVLPRGDAKLQSQLARIRELVEQSSWILSSGLRLSAPALSGPLPVPVGMSLNELITESFSSSGAVQGNVSLVLGEDLPLVRLDPRDGRALVDSLLMLFRTVAAGAPVMVMTSAPLHGGVLLEIGTSGNGSRGAIGAGSELAIESAQRIAEAHGGTFEIDAGGPSGGICGRLMLP